MDKRGDLNRMRDFTQFSHCFFSFYTLGGVCSLSFPRAPPRVRISYFPRVTRLVVLSYTSSLGLCLDCPILRVRGVWRGGSCALVFLALLLLLPPMSRVLSYSATLSSPRERPRSPISSLGRAPESVSSLTLFFFSSSTCYF